MLPSTQQNAKYNISILELGIHECVNGRDRRRLFPRGNSTSRWQFTDLCYDLAVDRKPLEHMPGTSEG